MSKNYYPEALEICLNEKTDFKAIVVAIAKTHPSLVVKNEARDGWKIEAKNLRDSVSKVEAIKFCRAETGLGLKEAKELVESL